MPKLAVKPEGAAVLKLPVLPRKIDAIPLATTNLVEVLKKAPDWAAQPGVQAAATKLATDGNAVAADLLAVSQATAVLRAARAARALSLRTLKTDRLCLAATLNVACAGSAAAVAAWNCIVAANVIPLLTAAAPSGLVLTNAKTAGEVGVRWGAVRTNKVAYLLQQADPATPGSWLLPMTLGKAKYALQGQTTGKVVTLRVAVVRTTTGQSVWSDPVSLTVR